MKRTRTIGLLAYDGVQPLDLFGPLDAFEEANDMREKGAPAPYRTVVLSETGAPVLSSSGVSFMPHAAIAEAPALHTLIIPGGAGSRAHLISEAVIDWVRGEGERCARIGSICTGIFILARTGLVDGVTVTTHWNHVEEARAAFPGLDIDADALFLRHGKVFTAAGVSSGIDLALSLIEEDMGAGAASEVARRLVVYLKRPGGQKQFSSMLQRQCAAGDEFADLLVWINDHLTEDLSSFALAERTGLSERQFRRRFQAAVGETPTRHVETMRIEAAREALVDNGETIEKIARSVGFASEDTFRRAFERRHGIAPSEYRQRFRGSRQ